MVDSSGNFTPINYQKVKKKKSLSIGKPSPVVFALASLLFMAVGLTGYLFVLRGPIPFVQKAYKTSIGPNDTCKLLEISSIESVNCKALSCPNGIAESVNQVQDYSVTYKIESKDNKPHTIEYGVNSNYCLEACGVSSGSGVPVCNSSPETKDHITAKVEDKAPLLINVSRSSASGQVCGSFQTDFWIWKIDGKSECYYAYKKEADKIYPGAASLCQTGQVCTIAVISPTVTVTPPAVSLTPNPEDDQGQPTKTPTPSPTQSVDNTSTPTPNLIVQVPTSTGTPAPSATPIPVACGTKGCDNTTNPCRDGLICVQANDGSNYCALPEFQTACRENPSHVDCCTAPAPTEIILAQGGTSTPVPTDVSSSDVQGPAATGTTEIPSAGISAYLPLLGIFSFSIVLLGLIL